jgi:hypothetical protein
VVDHLGHEALAGRDFLRDGADEVLGDVDDQVLHRLQRLTLLARVGDDLGLADLDLEALTPHQLDEDGQL